MGRIISVTALILLVVSASAAQNEKERNAAIALNVRAFEVSVLSAGNSPFQLHARIRIPRGKAAILEGAYELRWADKDTWREQITLPNYTETRTREGNHVRVQRSSLLLPSCLRAVRMLLSPSAMLAISPKDTVLKVKDTTFEKTRARCYVKVLAGLHEHTTCFDRTTGALIGSQTDWGTKRVYGDFQRVGPKLVAHHISYYEDGKLTEDIFIDDVSFPDHLEIPPASDGQEFEACDNQGEIRILKSTMPSFPRNTGRFLHGWLVLNKDGTVTEAAIEDTMSDDQRLQIVRKLQDWKFEPATCGNRPVAAEFGVSIETMLPHSITINYPYNN